jgi:hypothetical protein
MGLAAQFGKDAIVRSNHRAIGALAMSGAAVGAEGQRDIGTEGGEQLVQVRAVEVLDEVSIPFRQQSDVIFECIWGGRRWYCVEAH